MRTSWQSMLGIAQFASRYSQRGQAVQWNAPMKFGRRRGVERIFNLVRSVVTRSEGWDQIVEHASARSRQAVKLRNSDKFERPWAEMKSLGFVATNRCHYP